MAELSREQRLELGKAADALLKSEIFNKVLTHLTSEYINKMMGDSVGSLTSHSAHATLLALKDIKQAVTVLASEVAVQARTQK